MSAPSSRQLAWIIARDVNRTVGGGMASMELLRRSFETRKWVDASTHGLFVAVSRLTPGTNILAYCAAAGWRLQGWQGTLAELAAAFRARSSCLCWRRRWSDWIASRSFV